MNRKISFPSLTAAESWRSMTQEALGSECVSRICLPISMRHTIHFLCFLDSLDWEICNIQLLKVGKGNMGIVSF